MTNQEQYELIWEKAEKYDRLVGILDKIRADISKSKTKHEMQIAERDIKVKLLISDIYCDIVNILDKYKVEDIALGREEEKLETL